MEEYTEIIRKNIRLFNSLKVMKRQIVPTILHKQIAYYMHQNSFGTRRTATKLGCTRGIVEKSIKTHVNEHLKPTLLSHNELYNLMSEAKETRESLIAKTLSNQWRQKRENNTTEVCYKKKELGIEGRTFLNPQINELIETLKLMIAEEDLKMKIYNEMKSLIENK